MKDWGLRVSATIFLVIGIMHIARLIWRVNIVAGCFVVPSWLSIVAVIFTLSLSYWLFSLSKKK